MSSEVDIVHQELRRVAKGNGITNYTDVGLLVGLDMNSPADRHRISEILDEISGREHRNGSPLLSAVVVLKEHNIPGEGFFKFAQDLSLYDGGEDLMFWLKEIRRVHDFWAKQS